MAQFDKSKMFTALNADELKVGSKVYVAETISTIKELVEEEIYLTTIKEVMPENCMRRFRTAYGSDYPLAYLIQPPEEKKLKVSDLKLGDIVRHKSGNLEYLVIGIDHSGNEVFFGDDWSDDTDLINWEKVEK
jgi:hypothetical protein